MRRRSSRLDRQFYLAYTAGVALAVLLLTGILVFVVLLWTKDTDTDFSSVTEAIKNLTFPETNLTFPVTPSCLLYQYDVPYACGSDQNTNNFDQFVEGDYASVMMVMNPFTIDITYSAYITASIPINVNNNTGNNLILPSKTSEIVYNCLSPDNIFAIDLDKRDFFEQNNNDVREDAYQQSVTEESNGDWEKPDDVLKRDKRNFSLDIVQNGKHMENLRNLKNKIIEKDGLDKRAPADFYAGVFSVTSPYTISVWGIQTTVNVATDAPSTEIVPATVNCILFDS